MSEQVSLYQRFAAGQPFQLFGDAGLPLVPTPSAGVFATAAVWTVRAAAASPDPGVLQKTSASGAITILDTGVVSFAAHFACLLSALDTQTIGSTTLLVYDLKVTWSDGTTTYAYSGPILGQPGPTASTVASMTVTVA